MNRIHTTSRPSGDLDQGKVGLEHVERLVPCVISAGELALCTPANDGLQPLSDAALVALSTAKTQTRSSGEPLVADSTPWRHAYRHGHVLLSTVTVRRVDENGVWDLRARLVACDDPHVEQVVVHRSSRTAETSKGEILCAPVDRWRAPVDVLTDAEVEALLALAEDATEEPSDVTNIWLSRETRPPLRGFIRLDGDLGVATVVVTSSRDLSVDDAASELRQGVLDGRIRVRDDLRARLELGTITLVCGGAL